MSQDPPPADALTPQTSVVQWGDQPSERRRPLLRALSSARRDRRVVTVCAGVGAVAVFASLISEWQVTLVDRREIVGPEGRGGSEELLSRLGDLGVWGTGYLFGVFLLAASVALVAYGPAPVRATARVVALSTAGVLAVLLAALGIELGQRPAMGAALAGFFDDRNLGLSYGRGLVCAFAAVAALGLAAHLAPQGAPSVGGSPAATDAPVEAGADDPERAERSWRRPHGEELPEPLDLTVQPAAPFTTLSDSREDRR